MNPFHAYRKTYVAACFATAAAYAFTAGNQPVPYRIADMCIYGCVLCFAGIALRNLFTFAFPGRHSLKYRLLPLSVLLLLSGLFVVGTETFAMYLCAPSLFACFAGTIPVRLFTTLLILAVFRLCFLLYNGREDTSTGREEARPAAPQPVDRITVRSGQKIKIIPLDDILYIKADGDYVSIHTSEGSWLKEQTMKHTGDLLPPDRFLRIHRSYIVNTNHISRIERYGERWLVALHNREKIKISAARYHSLKAHLGL
jgi:hypothetical protein